MRVGGSGERPCETGRERERETEERKREGGERVVCQFCCMSTHVWLALETSHIRETVWGAGG